MKSPLAYGYDKFDGSNSISYNLNVQVVLRLFPRVTGKWNIKEERLTMATPRY